MTTTKVPFMDVGLFICGRLPKAGCQEPNCRAPHVATCPCPLEGRLAGRTCGRRACARHRRPDNLCAPHARQLERQAAAAEAPR